MHRDIMRLHGNFGDDLFIESYPATDAARVCQQSVVKPFPPSKPVSTRVKSYPRHENQVQLV